MKLENGNIVLNADEIELLSVAKMERIHSHHPVEEFIGSMASIKEECEEYIKLTNSKPDFSDRDALKIEITQYLVEICETFSERAYREVKNAGYFIKWQ
jgi:DNA polymerase III alpha subunit